MSSVRHRSRAIRYTARLLILRHAARDDVCYARCELYDMRRARALFDRYHSRRYAGMMRNVAAPRVAAQRVMRAQVSGRRRVAFECDMMLIRLIPILMLPDYALILRYAAALRPYFRCFALVFSWFRADFRCRYLRSAAMLIIFAMLRCPPRYFFSPLDAAATLLMPLRCCRRYAMPPPIQMLPLC